MKIKIELNIDDARDIKIALKEIAGKLRGLPLEGGCKRNLYDYNFEVIK